MHAHMHIFCTDALFVLMLNWELDALLGVACLHQLDEREAEGEAEDERQSRRQQGRRSLPRRRSKKKMSPRRTPGEGVVGGKRVLTPSWDASMAHFRTSLSTHLRTAP